MHSPPKFATEVTTLEFIQLRYLELGFSDNPMELFAQARLLRAQIAKRRTLANAAVALGLALGIFGVWGLVESVASGSFNQWTLPIGLAFIATAWLLLIFGFRSEREIRIRVASDGFAINHSVQFERVFQPILTGDVQVASISTSGRSVGFTPVSNRPIDRYVVPSAFGDKWLPAELLFYESDSRDLKESIASEFVVVLWKEAPNPERKPKGTWQKYYLWHQPPDTVAAAFDETPGIYHDDVIKRTKVRIAILEVCRHFEKQAAAGAPVLSQAKLAKHVADKIKLEANRLLNEGKSDDLEARKLERIAISGELKSLDPADPKAGLNDKPESWFFLLLSGKHDKSSPQMRATMLKKFPTLPLYVED